MEYKKFEELIVLRVQKGEELVESIRKVAENEKIELAVVSGIGATDDACVGFLDLRQKIYTENTFMEPMEITSIIGNITTMEGKPYIHIHANLSNSEGKVYGGHLDRALISITAEVFIQTFPASVHRKKDEETGINLLHFD